MAKYISKTELSSRSSEDFAREVLDTMALEDEVSKFCQKIIKQCTADHDYSLPEVHLYANQGEAFKFSWDMKAYIIFPRILAAWLMLPGGLNIVFSVLNIIQRPQHGFLAKLWHKNDVFDEKQGVWRS